MRNQAMPTSNQSSLELTIPENDEFSSSNFSTPPNNLQENASQRPPISTFSSPSASISSLSSIGGVNSSVQPPRHFRRSQTGSQLLNNRSPWSRYALRQISLDSSTSSLVSTTSSNAVLLPTTNKMPQTTESKFASSKSCSIFGSNQQYSEETNKRPKSSTLAGFEEKFVNLYATGLSSSNEDLNAPQKYLQKDLDIKHQRSRSIWRKQDNRPASSHISEMVKRSASTGRLNKNSETNFIAEDPAVRPPFFAYKVLTNIWIGDMRSRNCEDLLSDGGGEDYETRHIRRRVYVDFGSSNKQIKMNWPEKTSSMFDYFIPVPRREKLQKKTLFLNMVEFFKILNKSRLDGSQVLVYGQSISVAQYFVAAYLIILFNKLPETALDMVSNRSKSVIVSKVLLDWLYDLRNFLNQKSITIGQIEGDVFNVKLVEAVRPFNFKYVIRRGNEAATPNYHKYINAERPIESHTPFLKPSTPLPTKVPQSLSDEEATEVDTKSIENFPNLSVDWNMPQRPKSRA
ncbi:hypothetical protein M3Y97_00571300 [Aphelenchoides bicaudatus]|nr:hypothetical protein M3Y97_00571300 [Aphelenchoides bicaudatus]